LFNSREAELAAGETVVEGLGSNDRENDVVELVVETPAVAAGYSGLETA